VEYINKTFLAFLGYPAMEAFNAAGENLCRRIHQINDRLIRDEPNETIQVMLTQSQQQIVYFRNDKGEISSPYIASFSCFDDQRKCIFTFTDVTQIEGQKSELKEKVKQAEAKQEKQRRIMEIQERQSQMGEMIGSIAHQWKQPLNLLSISAYDISETFRAGEMDKTYMEKYLHNINQTIRFMSSTIDDFRNFFQPSSVPFPFSPETAIKNILKMMGKLYTLQNIDITVTSDESLYVQGAENEFQQVIVNLLNNAKDAFLEKNLPDRTINIHIAKTNEAIRIDVCDNAGGIPESLIDQVFDSYFSTKTVDKGTGIGLYMSRQIIETKMQGTLTVANKNGGACFTITLPKLDA
jgi:signal transduction histidine kinase